MQAAAGGQIEAARLAEHGAGNPRAQALLHGPQHIVGVARPGDNQAVGGEAEGVEAGTEQVTPGEAPQRRPPAFDETGEQGGGKTFANAGSTGDDLVEGAARQATPGQRAINRGNRQGHGLHMATTAGAEFEGADAGAKLIQGDVRWHGGGPGSFAA